MNIKYEEFDKIIKKKQIRIMLILFSIIIIGFSLGIIFNELYLMIPIPIFISIILFCFGVIFALIIELHYTQQYIFAINENKVDECLNILGKKPLTKE